VCEDDAPIFGDDRAFCGHDVSISDDVVEEQRDVVEVLGDDVSPRRDVVTLFFDDVSIGVGDVPSFKANVQQ
jgi:hypothetical protein